MTPSVAPLSMLDGLRLPGLSSGARMALTALLSFRNRGTGLCNPTIETLRKRLGDVEERTLRRWMRELRLAGVLKSKKRHTTTEYDFHISDFHSVENEPKNVRCQRTKMSGVSGQKCPVSADKNVRSLPPHPYMNQKSFNRSIEQENPAAAEAYSGVVGPVEDLQPQAASAALPPAEKVPERTAAPRAVQSSETSGQLDLELEAPRPVLVPARTLPPVDIKGLARAMGDRLIAVHPTPGLPYRAFPRIEAILRASPDPLKTAERIWDNHATWIDYWATLPAGRMIPQLWNWLESGEWEYPAVTRKPAQRESLAERTKALWRENIAKRGKPW